MLRLDELLDQFEDELGPDLFALTGSAEVTRWLNQGQRRLGWYVEREAALTWDAADTTVDFPTDFAIASELIVDEGSILPPHRVWSNGLRFLDPEGADSAGTATLLYQARPLAITDSQASELTDEGDNAIVAYACYRFYYKLAAGRADYRRYSTLAGANAVGTDDLGSLAQSCYDEFLAARGSIPVPAPVTFFGD